MVFNNWAPTSWSGPSPTGVLVLKSMRTPWEPFEKAVLDFFNSAMVKQNATIAFDCEATGGLLRSAQPALQQAVQIGYSAYLNAGIALTVSLVAPGNMTRLVTIVN